MFKRLRKKPVSVEEQVKLDAGEAFLRAKELAAKEDMQLCGTVDGTGRPRYFTMNKDASDEAIQKRAFELRHGRPMGIAEKYLHEQTRDRAEA